MEWNEEEKPKAFKVDDRRRFSSEGDPEAGSRAEAARPSEPRCEAPHAAEARSTDATAKVRCESDRMR